MRLARWGLLGVGLMLVWQAQAGSYDDFFRAVRVDDAAEVTQLLERGFDPNTPTPEGLSGLALAIKETSFKVVGVLLQHPDIRVEARTPADESPLMLAALKGNLALCEQLIAREADVNKSGWTPLHYAATGGHASIVRLLLEHFAYIDAESPNGSTPLMMAAMYGNLETVQALLDAGADARMRNQLGLSALDFAVRGEHPDAVALLTPLVRPPVKDPAW